MADIQCVWCGGTRAIVEKAMRLLRVPDGYPCCEIRASLNQAASRIAEDVTTAMEIAEAIKFHGRGYTN